MVNSDGISVVSDEEVGLAVAINCYPRCAYHHNWAASATVIQSQPVGNISSQYSPLRNLSLPYP